jgi:hypothetical protein
MPKGMKAFLKLLVLGLGLVGCLIAICTAPHLDDQDLWVTVVKVLFMTVIGIGIVGFYPERRS